MLTLVVAVMGLALTLQLTDFLGHPVDNFLAIFGFDNDATPQVVDSRTLVLELKELAVLETAQSGILITKTIVDSSAAPDAELQVSYVGTVKAGIDLAAIAPEDIVVADGVVSIKLPPPAITYCDLGKPEVHVWECRGWAGLQDCGSRYTRLQSEAYDRALDELLETALELGLNELAQEHAQQVLYDLLVQLGFEQVQFETQEAVTTPDVSCLPRDS